MSSGYIKFIKAQGSALRQISTGSVLLDRAFQIPLHSFMLLRGKPSTGTTSIALELCKQLTQNKLVVFHDMGDSLFPHRLHGINIKHLVTTKLTNIPHLLEFASDFSKENTDSVYILDCSYLIREKSWDLKHELPSLSARLRKMDPLITVIATQKHGMASTVWSQVVDVSLNQNIYWKGELRGHLANVEGPIGKETIYIEYHTGRPSLAYELAILQKENGTNPSSYFTDGTQRIQGFWNFVHTLDGQLNNHV
jgi:hypothetical protein